MSAIRALCQVSSRLARPQALRTVSHTRFAVGGSAVSRMGLHSSAVRAFGVSVRRIGEGSSDVLLSQKLQEELNFETADGAEEVPEVIKSFLAQGTWSVNDVPGNDEVTLTRKFGNEELRLIFSIADVQEDPEFDGLEGEEGESEDTPTVYPIRTSLSITKSNVKGALNVDLVCQENHFIVENVSFYNDAKLGTELTAEADWKRRGLYIGPQFETLDMSLQEEFEKYLQERGVNEGVATFIPAYADHKEQKEYREWLSKVKVFVDQ